MNRVWLFFILVTLSMGLFSQDYVPWTNIRHSSYTSQNTMDFRCESAVALFSELLFSYKSGGNWTEIPMTNIENVTYGATVPYSIGQDFHYLIKARRDSLVWLTPSKITTTTFPPAIGAMSFIGPDPTGDSSVLNDNNVDITGTYFGYSDTKFYTAIQNVSGTFPALAGFTGFNVYICGLINPESVLADSSLYAMVYVNIPFMYSQGIYKVKLSLTDFIFERIGNAQAQVSNGKLFMSCNISDLTADAAFGSWPNTTHILAFDAAIIQIALADTSLLPTIADWGPFSTLSFEDYFVSTYTNHPPVLSNIILVPGVNQRLLTVTYTDEDTDFPLTAEVVLDNNETIPMTTLLPVFTSPVEFTCNVPATGWSTGTLRFSDNNNTFVTAPISLTANQDVTAPAPALLQISPNPFYLRTNASLNITIENKANKQSEITIYNLKGQKVKHLVSASSNTGTIHQSWNGKDESDKFVSPGIYLCQSINETGKSIRKFLILP